MRGSNHSLMNVITAGYVGMTGFLIMKTDAPDYMKTAVTASMDFLMDNGTIPMVMYASIIFIAYLVGSILPDIDHPYSKLGRVIHVPVKHRTWLHAIYLPSILLVTGIFFRWVFWLGLGCLFHLVWDSPSASGIDWFYPKRGKHRVKLYYTGQASEYIFVSIFVAVFILYAVFVLQMVYHFIK